MSITPKNLLSFKTELNYKITLAENRIFDYAKAFKEARENELPNIWFDEENRLIA